MPKNMPYFCQDELYAQPRRARRAGHTKDRPAMINSRRSPCEHGTGAHLIQTFVAEDLTKAGKSLFKERLNGFPGSVQMSKPGAPTDDNGIRIAFFHCLPQHKAVRQKSITGNMSCRFDVLQDHLAG